MSKSRSQSEQPVNPALNRRQFLGNSARNAAQAAASVVGLAHVSQLQARERRSPNETVRVGVAGLRNQGDTLLQNFLAAPNCAVTAVCDIDDEVLRRGAARVASAGASPRAFSDFHQMLDNAELDAVVIATPDHHHAWMAALAAGAGKDLYLETPTTHSREEGFHLRDMLRKSGVVVQTGLSHRSGEHYRSAMEYIHSGELGPVRYARAWACMKRQKLKPQPAAREQLDSRFAAQWLGKRSAPPLSLADWHFHWRWFWNFGGGELSTWGTSLLDIARWGLNVATPQRVAASGGCFHFSDGRETPDTLSVQYDFGDSMIVWEHRQNTHRGPEGRAQGVAFHGERGMLIVDPSGWKVYEKSPAQSHQATDSQAAHIADFLTCVRERRTPRASFETGCLSSDLCHLGNLAYRQGREWRLDDETSSASARATESA